MNSTDRVAKLRASILSQLDTPERQERAKQSAWTMGNLMGGRPSDNLSQAVANILDLIAQGRESEELYTERASREYWEARA